MSESLDDLLRRVDSALVDHANADRTTQTVQLLTNLNEQLSPYVDDLGRVAAAFSALDQVGKSAERPDTRTLTVACRKAAELVRQNKSGPQDLPRTLGRIKEVTKQTTVTAQDSWREFIDACMPGLDSLSDLAEMLSQVGADRAEADSLRKSVTVLRTLSRRLPDETGPGQAASTVIAIRAALAALLGDSEAENEEVRLFLEAVARGGAHVRMLTQAVMDWMARTDTVDSFKIVAGRPASEYRYG